MQRVCITDHSKQMGANSTKNVTPKGTCKVRSSTKSGKKMATITTSRLQITSENLGDILHAPRPKRTVSLHLGTANNVAVSRARKHSRQVSTVSPKEAERIPELCETTEVSFDVSSCSEQYPSCLLSPSLLSEEEDEHSSYNAKRDF